MVQMHHYTTGLRLPRLTISLSEERHRALKEATARRNKSITALIEESLEHYGIKTTETAAALMARSRRTAALKEDEAREIAIEETRRGAPRRTHSIQLGGQPRGELGKLFA